MCRSCRLAAGQLLVTLPDSEPLSKCAISLIDMSGRTIAAHTFYGNTTVVDATGCKGVAILLVRTAGAEGTVKLLLP